MATSAASVEAATQAVEFGASMREMRRAHNRELVDVAAILKIRLVYLQAIEDGRFNALPGRTYATGFVRAYADYLGLDLVEVMRRYREITGDQPAQGPLVPPSPVIEARLPTGFILLVAAVLALAAYGGWYYLTVDGRDPVEVVAKLPARIAAMVGLENTESERPLSPPPAAAAATSSVPSPESANSPASVAAPVDKPAVAMPATVQPALSPGEVAPPAIASPAPAPAAVPVPPAAEIPSSSVSPPPSEGVAGPVPPETPQRETSSSETAPTETPTAAISPPAVAAAVETPPVTPPSETTPVQETPRQAPSPAMTTALPTPPVPPADAGTGPVLQPEARSAPAFAAGRVILRASAITWVELRDASGKRLFSRLMKRGETFTVPPTAGIVLETGNAGGLDILVDGTAIASLGPQGAVRRGVLLEPDALLSGAPGGR